MVIMHGVTIERERDGYSHVGTRYLDLDVRPHKLAVV